MQRVLITGGCGFIGTNLAGYLLSTGSFELTLLDNFSTAVSLGVPARSHLASNTRVIQGDIRDRRACDEAVASQDAVVHLAAYTQVVESLRDPAQCYDVNIQGTINLLEACRERRVPRFVFASSNAAVGAHSVAISERTVAVPVSPYGATKLAGEALCSAYSHSYGIETVALRFSNVYGPHCLKKSSVVAKFMQAMLGGAPLTIYGDGMQTRDFVHVVDLCQAIKLCLSHADHMGVPISGEILQVASGVETSVLELVEVLARVIGAQPQVRFEQPRCGEITTNVSDISKARTRLGFTPTIALEEGLGLLHQWLRRKYVVRTTSPEMMSS